MQYSSNPEVREAQILSRIRDYEEVAYRGIKETDRRKCRKAFNRMIQNHSEIAKAHGYEPLTPGDCGLD